jgi:hydrogenase maturation protein HypF
MGDAEIRDITRNHIVEALPNGPDELELILKQARAESVLKTSSSGRFLDSVASLLGLTYRRTYEGEPAIRLEACAELGDPNKIDITPEIEDKNGKYVLKIDNTLKYLVINRNRFKKQDIAAFAQKYVSEGFAEIAVETARRENIKTIALSGGVAVNGYISDKIIKYVENADLRVLTNRKTPLGDGGSALGQSCVALASVI